MFNKQHNVTLAMEFVSFFFFFISQNNISKAQRGTTLSTHGVYNGGLEVVLACRNICCCLCFC
jgi:hypothetical protein